MVPHVGPDHLAHDLHYIQRLIRGFMKNFPFQIIRVGLGVTFLWIGLLIFKNPEAWGNFLEPWALALLPVPLKEAMIGTALLDVVIGALLIADSFVWIASALAAMHLLIILIVSGITEITSRDIGLLAAALALFFNYFPRRWLAKFRH